MTNKWESVSYCREDIAITRLYVTFTKESVAYKRELLYLQWIALQTGSNA